MKELASDDSRFSNGNSVVDELTEGAEEQVRSNHLSNARRQRCSMFGWLNPKPALNTNEWKQHLGKRLEDADVQALLAALGRYCRLTINEHGAHTYIPIGVFLTFKDGIFETITVFEPGTEVLLGCSRKRTGRFPGVLPGRLMFGDSRADAMRKLGHPEPGWSPPGFDPSDSFGDVRVGYCAKRGVVKEVGISRL